MVGSIRSRTRILKVSSSLRKKKERGLKRKRIKKALPKKWQNSKCATNSGSYNERQIRTQSFDFMKKVTKQVMVRDVPIGGGTPAVARSMTRTNTTAVDSTIRQIA